MYTYLILNNISERYYLKWEMNNLKIREVFYHLPMNKLDNKMVV